MTNLPSPSYLRGMLIRAKCVKWLSVEQAKNIILSICEFNNTSYCKLFKCSQFSIASMTLARMAENIGRSLCTSSPDHLNFAADIPFPAEYPSLKPQSL